MIIIKTKRRFSQYFFDGNGLQFKTRQFAGRILNEKIYLQRFTRVVIQISIISKRLHKSQRNDQAKQVIARQHQSGKLNSRV